MSGSRAKYIAIRIVAGIAIAAAVIVAVIFALLFYFYSGLKLSGTPCYGLSDREVLDHIQRAYVNHGQMTPEDARNSRVDRERVLGVERDGNKGEDAFVGMLFLQDNLSILSIRIFEDCEYVTSPSQIEDLKNWAYPLSPPKF